MYFTKTENKFMNWYKRKILIKESEWKWRRFLGSFGLTTILGLASLYNLGLLELEKLYAENPQKVEQMAQQYISQSKENELINKIDTNTLLKKDTIEEKTQRNIKTPSQSSTINLDKIHQIESSSGKDRNAFRPNKAGALGHFQFRKPTWDEMVRLMGKNWGWETGAIDYNKSKQVADFYLNQRIPQMLNHYNIPDTIEARIGAYNWGIGFLKRAYERYGNNWVEYAPTETRNYIQKYYN